MSDLKAATGRGDELDELRERLENEKAEQGLELGVRWENIQNLEVELQVEKDHRSMEQAA